jgi:hypothetical protein
MESDLLLASHMVEIAEPAGEPGRALGVLAVARTIMSYNDDQDLIEKVAVLQEYVELSRMFPDRDYTVVIRKAISQVVGEIQWALKSELIMSDVERNRRDLLETSRTYTANQGILFAD